MIEVLVVDDHTIFRAGVARLLGDEPDIRVTGEACDGPEAMRMIRARPFDLVLMDINMRPRSGLDTLVSLRAEKPRLPVIMLSMYLESQYARQAIKARANAYLSKDVGPEELVHAVRQVARGGVYVTRGYALERAGAMPAPPQGRPAHEVLSPREMQVLHKIACGVSLTEIGAQMCVSVKTIATHRSRVLDKLGMTSNAQLVQYAVRHGLVD